MTPIDHALLSASSSARWLQCPPSVRLTEHMPDTESEYAAAGRLAHSIAEFKARAYFLEPMAKRTISAGLKKFQSDPLYDKEMDSSTDAYVEHLKSRAMAYPEAPVVALETRVDYSDIAPEGFGTADCLMVGGGMLDVIDYKNGAGVPVEAERNSQMMLYAWGALAFYRPFFGDSIERIHLSIVQPNAGGIREWELPVGQLEFWASQVARPIAEKAWRGEGNFKPGDWCRFCKAKAQCSARAAKMLELEPMTAAAPAGESDSPAEPGVSLLSDAQVGEALSRGRLIAAWVKDLEDYALSACLDGREIPGWKAVEGRGARDWTGGADTAFSALRERGVPEAMLYERRPVTVPALEKALGKKEFSTAADGLWQKSPGKPTLVPQSDKRPPYNAAAAAFGE